MSIQAHAPRHWQHPPGTKGNKKQAPSGETALRCLLTAGASYSEPIDVEAVDTLMWNFPIIEEHQVCFAGFDLLKTA